MPKQAEERDKQGGKAFKPWCTPFLSLPLTTTADGKRASYLLFRNSTRLLLINWVPQLSSFLLNLLLLKQAFHPLWYKIFFLIFMGYFKSPWLFFFSTNYSHLFMYRKDAVISGSKEEENQNHLHIHPRKEGLTHHPLGIFCNTKGDVATWGSSFFPQEPKECNC